MVVRDWNEAYESEQPPWDIDRPQPSLSELFDTAAVRGRVLDVGCGTGEHALLAAARGLAAVGVDCSSLAIAKAREKAGLRGLDVRFLEHSALALHTLGEQFDSVIDSGLFHVFSDEDRGRYVESLGAVLAPGGRYFMLCFSDLVPGTFGPRRIRQDEIRSVFGDAATWLVEEIAPARFVTRVDAELISAWRATMRRQ